MAFLNSEQIEKYQEDLEISYTNQIKYDNKVSSLYTGKAAAIAKFDTQIANNEAIVDNNKELIINLMVNYFLHTDNAFSADYPAIWDYIGLKVPGDFIIINGTRYDFEDLGRINS